MAISSKAVLLASLGLSSLGWGAKRDLRIPNEYEQAGSSPTGILNAGTTEADSLSAVQINPALLVLNREYSVGIAYHWPDKGRNFYRAGIVDGVTSTYAAAVTYTGFQEEADALSSRFDRDSLVTKRASLGLAYPFKNFALGFAVNYQEGVTSEIDHQDVVRGISLGLGAVAFLTKSIKVGLAAQNLNNKGLETISPAFYRFGLSWQIVPEWVVYGDLRSRSRIEFIEGPIQPIEGLDLDAADLEGQSKDEHMAYFGNHVQIFNLLRVGMVYGTSVNSDDPRQSLAGGIGLSQQSYSFMYSVSKPYLAFDEIHTALSLQVLMKM